MTISLSDRVSMASSRCYTFTIGSYDRVIGSLLFFSEPGKECRTKVEAYVSVIVDDRSFGTNMGEGVGTVALTMNSLVPIVIRSRAGLIVDNSGPGVLTRRLIEMAVND